MTGGFLTGNVRAAFFAAGSLASGHWCTSWRRTGPPWRSGPDLLAPYRDHFGGGVVKRIARLILRIRRYRQQRQWERDARWAP